MNKPFIIDFQNALEIEQSSLPELEQIELWAESVLKLFETEAELTIRVVELEESQLLNFQYRGKNSPTNVLSFPSESHESLETKLLGDLVICHAIVAKEAQEQGKKINAHYAHMVIHGCLHLLGYDHIEPEDAEEMESIEIEVMESLGFKNPYEID
ncbi:rRNA maturation RNase YbeY [Thorsellia anophelis]|uniref:Endoribonuclease YbeY n=1 Tax=Thorsellia anophelis DSM 18579 TaxID=1123402 RepID=A0A1I0BQW1_9GAMM|nr:rRNA maturation RNase YbeY [Thorsellia anophelis]SET09331.1 probable rRNA maturation factor [Thorsellia anophelis DSM 18579]